MSQIVKGDAVFIAPAGDPLLPDFPEIGAPQTDPVGPQSLQPDQLQFQIVIRNIAQMNGLLRHIHCIRYALIRHSDRTAQAFPEPATINFVSQYCLVHRQSFSLLLRRIIL